MTNPEFSKLCDEVLVPKLRDILHGHERDVEEMFGTIMRDLMRIGDTLEASMSAQRVDDGRL